eukprot:1223325-Rhodomonas_salina.1
MGRGIDVIEKLEDMMERALTEVSSAICLRACYVMSSTDMGNVGSCLHACYAMSSADIGHVGICLRACYAVSGTDTEYGGIRRARPKG